MYLVTMNHKNKKEDFIFSFAKVLASLRRLTWFILTFRSWFLQQLIWKLERASKKAEKEKCIPVAKEPLHEDGSEVQHSAYSTGPLDYKADPLPRIKPQTCNPQAANFQLNYTGCWGKPSIICFKTLFQSLLHDMK
jgi:hypothetical protein